MREKGILSIHRPRVPGSLGNRRAGGGYIAIESLNKTFLAKRTTASQDGGAGVIYSVPEAIQEGDFVNSKQTKQTEGHISARGTRKDTETDSQESK
jgi:hypothetical protein